MKPLRIALYGNFGAGNLGNECTLQAVIEQIRARRPDADILCLCTDPRDVEARHGVPALEASSRDAAPAPAGRLRRALRLVCRRAPAEAAHWLAMLRALRGRDVLVVAGTGIVADYLCGPMAWPYDLFKLGVLARLARTRFVFLSVGTGPIVHPLSRFFIGRSLRLAHARSYRDAMSKHYLQHIGVDTAGDRVFPDLVFGLGVRTGDASAAGAPAADAPAAKAPAAKAPAAGARVVGLGLKDYAGAAGRVQAAEHERYLDLMCEFVAQLHARGSAVRLLIGDFRYDGRVMRTFVERYRAAYPRAQAPLLAEEAASVDELMRQLAGVDLVVSARYHNLVMAAIQDKPIMALSDHPKMDALLTELGLERHLVPLEGLRCVDLLARFERLEREADALRPFIRRRLADYRRRVGEAHGTWIPGPC